MGRLRIQIHKIQGPTNKPFYTARLKDPCHGLYLRKDGVAVVRPPPPLPGTSTTSQLPFACSVRSRLVGVISLPCALNSHKRIEVVPRLRVSDGLSSQLINCKIMILNITDCKCGIWGGRGRFPLQSSELAFTNRQRETFWARRVTVINRARLWPKRAVCKNSSAHRRSTFRTCNTYAWTHVKFESTLATDEL